MDTIAFPYERKSPDDKEDTDRSLENQRELIKNTCLGKGWKLYEKDFFDKNISGGDRDRKGLKDCISEARKYKVTHPKENVYIVVKDQDRFARDSSFFRDTIKSLEVYGVRVFSIIKNDFLTHGDLGDSVMSLMNEQMIIEYRKKSILTRDKKINDKLPCIPAPFGYKYYKKNWVVVPKEAEIVKQVISDYLNKVNYRETDSRLKIDKGKYYRIILNSKKGLYNGLIKFYNKVKDFDGTIARKEEVEYEGTYEKILSEETFNKVQKLNKSIKIV